MSASVVIFAQPKGDWQKDTALAPVYIQVMQLPPAFGNTKTHCGQGEYMAINMTLEIVPVGYPIFWLNDAAGARNCYLTL